MLLVSFSVFPQNEISVKVFVCNVFNLVQNTLDCVRLVILCFEVFFSQSFRIYEQGLYSI